MESRKREVKSWVYLGCVLGVLASCVTVLFLLGMVTGKLTTQNWYTDREAVFPTATPVPRSTPTPNPNFEKRPAKADLDSV